VLSSGLSMLICTDVIRPSTDWLSSRGSARLAVTMAAYRDPEGFTALDQVLDADPAVNALNGQLSKARIAIILASNGGLVRDITVGDCVQFCDDYRRIFPRSAHHTTLFYVLLHRLRIFPADAPATLRALCGQSRGQSSTTQLVDRYQLQSGPIRALIIDYLSERRPGLDYSTLTSIAHDLAGLFWADLERHHPGINSLHLTCEAAIGWKERLKTKTRTVTDAATGRQTLLASPRHDTAGTLSTVRAFYLDIAQWALEEPTRWGPWAAPCPVKDNDLSAKKEKQAVKARMHQRTRERLPVLPALLHAANAQRKAAAERLDTAGQTPPGQTFTAAGQELLRPNMARPVNAKIWAQDPDTGIRRDLTAEDSDAFWAWAVIEVLSRTGIRIEELLELTHQAISSYRLPTTGEVVPLLQIAPSKTDAERLLLVDPELADVLSAIIARIRTPNGAVPLLPAYDYHERIWLPPMGLLFQRPIGGERRPFNPDAIYKILTLTLSTTGLTDTTGQPLHVRPHDFRRMFVTDAIMNGLPPHIAQIICGHADIATTMAYKAVYPTEAIDAHRAFIARRRAIRPGEEYRTPTDEEWDAFLSQFERRKLSVGICARAFNTPCIHEHACVRCPILRPDPSQRARLEEIRENLTARIAEADREGWLGEIEGLQVSLAGAEDKLAQLDAGRASLPTPTFDRVAGRIGSAQPAMT
jgi:integrase